VKISTTFALTLATALSGPPAAYAQTERPTIHHHYHVHHHHYLAHNPAPAPESTAGAQQPEAVQNSPLNQMFRPYAELGEGDNDGLSRDPDDCMKGCIGAAPQ
jgi:hypothetical protein